MLIPLFILYYLYINHFIFRRNVSVVKNSDWLMMIECVLPKILRVTQHDSRVSMVNVYPGFGLVTVMTIVVIIVMKTKISVVSTSSLTENNNES